MEVLLEYLINMPLRPICWTSMTVLGSTSKCDQNQSYCCYDFRYTRYITKVLLGCITNWPLRLAFCTFKSDSSKTTKCDQKTIFTIMNLVTLCRATFFLLGRLTNWLMALQTLYKLAYHYLVYQNGSLSPPNIPGTWVGCYCYLYVWWVVYKKDLLTQWKRIS
jgi:hypothetical protein